MISKKILNCSRALVVLVAITMGFVISLRHNDKPQKTSQKKTSQSQPVDLTAINEKLDRIIQESRMRDTVLLQQLLKIQQQQHGRAAAKEKIAEAFE